MTKTEPELLSRTDLRARGWTATGIRRFLGEPDATRENNWFRTAPMKFWTQGQVEAVESSAEWVAWLQSSRLHAEASQADAARHRTEGAAMAEAVVIEVELVDLDDARECAIWSYNERTAQKAGKYPFHTDRREASIDSDPEFLDRITVNFLRYERTSYDVTGEKLFRLVGRSQAHELLFERGLEAIEAEYPALAGECFRQLDARSL